MPGYFMLSTAVTVGNLSAGFLALVLATEGRFTQTALLVLLAAGFDSVDGPIARRAPAHGDFGVNLDSLADLVSFGAVPALALYLGTLDGMPVLGPIVCLAFLVCGAFRLARFPLVKDPDCFLGLPIPPAGLLVVTLVAVGTAPVLAIVTVVLVAALMVSEIQFPKLFSGRRLKELLHRQLP